jgi:UDP-N-acetylglucosamine 2-epimerase (non-hydrolysing)
MILITFGTRPEWIKIKPIIEKIDGKIPYRLVCTGQHETLIDQSMRLYNIEHITIDTGPNRLDDIVASILRKCRYIFDNIKYTMVQGDTTSAFAVALASFHRKIPVIHLEAGLRSWDINNPYPEEFNRLAISNLSSIHLCPTEENKFNVRTNHGKKYVVGNTVLDSLVHKIPTLENFVLVTLHRRENINNISEWFDAIEKLAQNNTHLEFIFPMHPNPEIQKYKHIFSKVKVIQPLSHEECIDYMARCAMVITDSGGIQEESSFLKKKCIVCRTTTERTEGEGIFSKLCPYPERLKEIFDDTRIELVNEQCPYGDGYASEKILKILETL